MKSENYRCYILTNSFMPCCFLYTGHLCINPWRDFEHSTLFSSCECWNYSRQGGLPVFLIPWGIRNLLLSFDSIQMSEACSFLSPALYSSPRFRLVCAVASLTPTLGSSLSLTPPHLSQSYCFFLQNKSQIQPYLFCVPTTTSPVQVPQPFTWSPHNHKCSTPI